MQIKSAKFYISSQKEKDCPKTIMPEYAFIGRSNVGKSSLINMITNQKKLYLKMIIIIQKLKIIFYIMKIEKEV